MTILCPGSMVELQDMLAWAVEKHNGPVALRYPRGADKDYKLSAWSDQTDVASNGALACHRTGGKVALITYGSLLQNVMDAAQELHLKGVDATVLRLLSVAPLPIEKVLSQIENCSHVVIIEETCNASGICEALAWQLQCCRPDCKITCMDLGGRFIPHGSIDTLYHHCRIDTESIVDRVLEVLKVEN